MELTHKDLTVILVGGDSESASQLSASHHLPVILASPGDSVSKSVCEAIAKAQTSHVLLLKGPCRIHSENGQWLDAAIETMNKSIPDGDGVVVLNDGSKDTNAHQFQLVSKKFIQEQVGEAPYSRFYFDTEIWEKAKRLGRSARAENSHVELLSSQPVDNELENKELELLMRRMSEWVDRTPSASKKVFIALPIYWDVNPIFFTSCLQVVQQFTVNGMRKGYREGLQGAIKPLIGDSAIGRARNSLTRQFLESDCTDLLWIDSDLKFTFRDIERIMSHPEEVVGGMYCKKQEGKPEIVMNPVTGREPEMTASGLVEVRYVGTGFMRVRRSVFHKMIASFGPSISYMLDPDHKIREYDFWHFGVCHYPDSTWAPRYLSEDWWFCEMCNRIGIKVWADRGILLPHNGNISFPLKHQESQLYGSPPDRCASLPAGAGEKAPTPAPALESQPV